MALRLCLAAALLASLPACATLAGGDIVWIEVAGDNACRIEASGQSFALPAEEPALAAHLRRLARAGDSALMSPRPALTSPGCWDSAMALVRAAGFRRIGYFSE
jgi:hypothetical protein